MGGKDGKAPDNLKPNAPEIIDGYKCKMKIPTITLPILLAVAISASGAPPVNGSAPVTTSGLNRPNTQNTSSPNAPQQPGITSKNNVGNGTFVNGMPGNNKGNGTFIQPGSPAAGGQNLASNTVTGQNVNGQNVNRQNITGQNTNQSGALGAPQQYNQTGGMTNRSSFQTNSANPQLGMTHPPLPIGNSNMPPP